LRFARKIGTASGMLPWTATVLTLFPEMFPGVLGHSLAGKALERGVWALETVNPRAFATDKHQSVDDAAYGGGTGLVLRADILGMAYESLALSGRSCYYLSPRGSMLTSTLCQQLAQSPGVVLVCGRYEGVDQRFLDYYQIPELSIGDYVLAGGEVAAMVVLEAVTRHVPGVIGNAEVHREESFEDGLLEYPHYTRPARWNGLDVPSVLQSGHHGAIAQWRQQQAQAITKARRPDLWEKRGVR
jgi:tRNA (guanine37-N1)-methyltransferase